ncbi:MAG: glycosyltransferase [Clostridiales bacterium]|nr:glycosyltransferase [Clostridiales bacterium]
MPLLTIIVPVYKVPYNLLKKCLDSIAAQTDGDYEAILVDDGSPDKCGEICESYAKKHSQFRVLHQKNGGLSVVRNNGVLAARTNWVSFVDGDDWIEPETVEYARKYIEKCSDADILIWESYYDIDGTSKEVCIADKYSDGKLKKFTGKDRMEIFDLFFPRFDGGNKLSDMGSTHARLYNRSFLLNNGIQNQPGLKKRQDNVFNLWVFEKAEKVYYQCVRLYHYTFNEEATTQKYSPDNINTLKLLYNSILKFVEECHNNADFHQRLYCKMMKAMNEVFRLNYAHPDNTDSFLKRRKGAAEALKAAEFQTIISEFDPKGQSRKLKLIYFLLMHRNYGILILMYTFLRKTQKIRMKMRK